MFISYSELNIEIFNKLINSSDNCILLDSARSDTGKEQTWFFYNPIQILTAFNKRELEALLCRVDELREDSFVVGYLSYEAAYCLEKRFESFIDEKNELLAWFGVFKKPLIFDHSKRQWLDNVIDSDTLVCNSLDDVSLEEKCSYSDYKRSLSKIREYIKAGDTYQINYTYDNVFKSKNVPFEIYCELRKKQKTPYCAFIKNSYHTISSFSPELFFKVDKNNITVKPMKGTASRGFSNEEDQKKVEALKNGEKDRAENLMIVDLLRNDLGRICKAGTVKTEKLFEVETHPTVHQMTSTITGNLQNTVGFSDIIKNIFPCGSVTGAPKIRSMEIIHNLETGKRGVYCGAIGFCLPNGDMKFNVPIRTLVKENQAENWNYRVGSGIVWDSEIDKEWLECRAKTAFLTEETNVEFDLVETIRVEKGKLIYYKDHLERIKMSAKYFHAMFNETKVQDTIDEFKSDLHEDNFILRLLLKKDGSLNCELLPLNDVFVTNVRISDLRLNSNNTYLYHKTTYRPWYKAAMDEIKSGKVFDVLFLNEKDEVAEGARSNVFIEKDGFLYTPSLSSGLLPGILRKDLLESGKCQEKVITMKDLKSADVIFCGNSVRGLVRVELELSE